MITKYNEQEELNERLIDNELQMLNESLFLNEPLVTKSEEPIDECIQIGDAVKLNGEKGYVIGQTNDGDLIVQIQGHTEKVKPKKLKAEEKKEITTEPHMKFDKVSLKLLFEQYVRCGIFQGNIPVKTNNCYTKFSDFNNANDEQVVSVIIEGSNQLISKKLIKIFEDVNDFANPDGYVSGVIVDEVTGEPIEPVEIVMINAADYTKAVGDADMVRVVRKEQKDDEFDGQSIDALPKGILKTLSI